jgi:hypothetical protein
MLPQVPSWLIICNKKEKAFKRYILMKIVISQLALNDEKRAIFIIQG